MAAIRNTLVLAVACVLAALGLIAPATATADEGTPAITLEKVAPATALIGSEQQVTLHAHNPAGQPVGYNLTFRDVLPAGVEYKGGLSGASQPQILSDSPNLGETTLIFRNVADLSPSSQYAISFNVKADPGVWNVGETYSDAAGAYVNTDPRFEPKFSAKGIPVKETTSITGTAEDTASTRLTAVEIEKSEPSPEHEVMRGVHDHQVPYTLKLRNNDYKETTNLVVDDYLPAGLEFLGCGETDNTTEAPTNKGSPEEYPGSGPIDPGNAPELENCPEPELVETVELKAGNTAGLAPGVYTHVRWTLTGAMAPSEEREIEYLAAIPIRENTMTWGTAGEPTPAGGEQAANLDNNSGAETSDEEQLTNGATVAGQYEGKTQVEDGDQLTVSAEDLAIQKSVTPTTISSGTPSTWKFEIETSEYRYVKGISIEDKLPNGVCPLGKENYENPIQKQAECDNPEKLEPTAEYASVEELADGEFLIKWNEEKAPALAEMGPSETLTLEFPTQTRVFYQENFENNPERPILTHDSWVNQVKMGGADFARCAPDDPRCEKGEPEIEHDEENGTEDTDVSEAEQQAAGVTVDKKVRLRLPEGKAPVDCETGTYVDGPAPSYRPGDEVCWQVRVDFAADLFAGEPLVTDFLPPDEEYIPGSAKPVAGVNTVSVENFTPNENVLEWTLGQSVPLGSKVFAYRFKSKMGRSPSTTPFDIEGNLMKFASANSEGETFPQRDEVDIEREEPELKIIKGVYEVGGTTVGGEKPLANNKNATGAHGGELVKYGIQLENTGTLEAKATEVWDRLPAGIECADVSTISNGGTCEPAENVIVWTGIAVAPGATNAALTYEAELPSDVAPEQTYKNTAGVRQFESETNSGEPFHYYPEANIDPKFGGEHPANTPPINDPATVSTEAATLEKGRETALEQEPGNNLENQATIGEAVKYTLTSKIPAGSKLFGSPTTVDPLGERLALVGKVKGSVNGVDIPDASLKGFTVGEEAGNPVLHFPATYENLPGSGADTIVLEFEATITDVAANNRLTGGTLTNTAVLNYEDQSGTAREVADSADTTIVEPVVEVEKSHAGAEIVEPGQEVEYTVVAKNPGGAAVSTANDSTVVDTVPAGMTPVNAGTPVVDGGTVGAQEGIWNATARTITWTITTLAPGASEPLHYDLRVNKPANAGSVFENTATITTTSLPGPQPGERTATSPSDAGYEGTANDLATLTQATLEKSVDPTTGTIGTPLTYKLKLKLPPEIEFFDTTVEDLLPAGVEYDGQPSISCAEGVAETPCAPAVPGQELPAEETPGGPTTLGWYFGTVPASANERVVTIAYKAHIAKEAGTPAAPVKAGDELVNTANGYYNNEPEFTKPPTTIPPAGDFKHGTGPAQGKTTVIEPQLGIEKAVTGEVAPPEKTQPGDKYTYTLTVTNNGGAPAYDVVVKDNNPQGDLRKVDPTATSSEGHEYVAPGWAEGDPLKWTIPGPIPAGGVVHLQYTAKLAESKLLHEGDKIENVADVPVYFGAPEATRKAEGEGRFRKYIEDPEDTVTLETSLPKPKVEKTVGTSGAEEGTAKIGEPFTWQVKVTNQATAATWKGVDVLDTLPAGWEYVTGSAEMPVGTALADPARSVNAGGEEELSWSNLADLGPGASFTVTFKAVPTIALALEPKAYTNHAKASGEDASGATESAAGPYEAKDTAIANLITPGLEIHKTPDAPEPGSEFVAGGPAAYSIEIHNSGAAEATSVEATDLLGPGNIYTAGSATATPPAGFSETAVEPVGTEETRVRWAIASIAPGGTVTIDVPVSLAPSIPDGETVVDHATVISAQERTPVPDEGSLLVKRETDVEITKEPTRESPLFAGEIQGYALNVKNNGPSDATGVVVEDELPANVTLQTTPIGCEEAAPGVKCNVGDLALNEELHFSFQVKIDPGATGTVVNKARVSSTTEDTEPDNDHDEVSTALESSADVAIHKSGPTAPVLRGSTFVYTLEVENIGPSNADNVTVEDPLPAELEGLAVDTDTGSCVEPLGTPVECDLGTMAPGQKALIHITVRAVGMPTGPEGVVNVATVTATADRESKNDSSEARTTVEPAADLAVTKTAPATVPAGGELTYGLHVENLGPSDGTEVQVTDPLPEGTQFVSADEDCSQAGGTVTCDVGELKVGEARDYQVTVDVPLAQADHDLVNTATVKGHEADPESMNDSSTVTTKAGPAADLAITKTMGKAQAGAPLTYTLAVTNKGPSASSSVTVKDTLPAGTTFKSAAPSQGTCSAAGQTVTCELGQLASGGSAQVSITVEVAASATGSLRNVATVEGPLPDPDKSNNESAVEGPVAPPTAAAPNLKVVKTADNSTPTVGTPFNYDVAVTNLSGGEAKHVKVVDTLDGPVKVVSIEAGSGHCSAAGSKITCTIPGIPVGKTVHITYSVVAEAAGPLSNNASAEAANGEKAPSNNHAVKSVKVKSAEGTFSLTKTATRKVVPGGKKVGYTITLRNGAAALTNAKVCDRLPAALVFVKAAGARYVNGEACWTKTYVAAHKVLRLHLLARAVKGYSSRQARNVATASAGNATRRSASATVRVKPAFAGKPGGVTG